jgi:DNA-binding CsgD family transcriptional regulator
MFSKAFNSNRFDLLIRSLSQRQQILLDLLLQGCSKDEICDYLGCSAPAYKRLLRNIAWRLGIDERFDKQCRAIYLAARERGMIE